MRGADLLVLVLCAILVGATWTLAWRPDGAPHTALVTTRDGARLDLPLERDATHVLQGRRGPVTIEVLAGRARIADSTCPQRLCVRAGWLTAAGESSVCLPNGVVLRLTGDGAVEYDALSL